MTFIDYSIMDFLLSFTLGCVIMKLWHYRCAIIKLQADMTLVLNELTRPQPVKLKKVQ